MLGVLSLKVWDWRFNCARKVRRWCVKADDKDETREEKGVSIVNVRQFLQPRSMTETMQGDTGTGGCRNS